MNSDESYQVFKAQSLIPWLSRFGRFEGRKWFCAKGCRVIRNLDDVIVHLKRHYPRMFQKLIEQRRPMSKDDKDKVGLNWPGVTKTKGKQGTVTKFKSTMYYTGKKK